MRLERRLPAAPDAQRPGTAGPVPRASAGHPIWPDPCSIARRGVERMRIYAALLLLGSASCAGCSGGETPPSPDEDGAARRDGGIWAPDRAPGIEILERGRALPPSHQADPAELRPDAGPGPFTDMRVHIRISGTIRTAPCAVPSGSFCDGFAVVDANGAMIAVDTYSYLGPKPPCRASWVDGSAVSSISGVWQQRTSGATELSVLALATCEGLDGPAPGAGIPAPPSSDVRQLREGWAPGVPVSVIGVVVARWRSSSGAFGFALQDPDGAPASGVRVLRPKGSSTVASAPEIGDRVRVTGRTGRTAEHLLEL